MSIERGSQGDQAQIAAIQEQKPSKLTILQGYAALLERQYRNDAIRYYDYAQYLRLKGVIQDPNDQT